MIQVVFACHTHLATRLATHFTFLREIPLFSHYELRSTLMSWDNKWVSSDILRTCVYMLIAPMYSDLRGYTLCHQAQERQGQASESHFLT